MNTKHVDSQEADATAEAGSEAASGSTAPAPSHDILRDVLASATALAAKSTDQITAALDPYKLTGAKDPGTPEQSARAKPGEVYFPLFAQKSLSDAQSSSAFKLDIAKAEADYDAAGSAWGIAMMQYETGLQVQQHVMQASIKAASDAYTLKSNHDSSSREQNLYALYQVAVTADLTTYAGATAQLGNALAGAAASLFSAYATYLAAVNQAAAKQKTAAAASSEALWSAVESGMDAL